MFRCLATRHRPTRACYAVSQVQESAPCSQGRQTRATSTNSYGWLLRRYGLSIQSGEASWRKLAFPLRRNPGSPLIMHPSTSQNVRWKSSCMARHEKVIAGPTRHSRQEAKLNILMPRVKINIRQKQAVPEFLKTMLTMLSLPCRHQVLGVRQISGRLCINLAQSLRSIDLRLVSFQDMTSTTHPSSAKRGSSSTRH